MKNAYLLKSLLGAILFILLANSSYVFGQICPVSTGTELITNGTFEAGNTGFASDYTFNASSVGPGNYSVGTNPNTLNSFFASIADHTPGAGTRMMVIDVDGVSGKDVYRTNVTVLANTTYFFSAWFANINNNTGFFTSNGKYENAPQLRFSINGAQVGATVLVDSTNHNWTQFFVNWNSGPVSGPITINIENIRTSSLGNDLALDDISFSTSCDRITNLNSLGQTSTLQQNVSTCNVNFPYTLNPNLPGSYNYSWRNSSGVLLPAPNTGTTYSVTSAPANGTRYYLCYEFVPGCPRRDSVTFTSTFNINLGPNRTRCAPVNELLNSGVDVPPSTVVWTRNGATIGGATSSTYTATQEGTYRVTATRPGCGSAFSEMSIIIPPASFTGSGEYCASNNTATFTASSSAVKWYTTVSGGTALNPSNSNPTINLAYSATRQDIPGCASGLFAEDVSSFNGRVTPTTAPCGSGGGDENGNRSPMQFTVNRDLTLNTVDILQPGFGYAGTANYVVRIYANNPTGGPYNGGCNCNLAGPGGLLFTSAVTSYPLPSSQTQRTINVNYAFTGIVTPTTYWLVVEENNGIRYQNCAGAFPYVDNSGQNAFTVNRSLKDNGSTTAFGHAFNWNFTAGNVYSCGRVFICANENCPAPVDYLSLTANKSGATNLVSWKTASEQNSAYFIIQRSIDGVNFESIGKVDAAGNSSSILSYTYMDYTAPQTGVVYYRLNQVDLDGTAHLSQIVAVKNNLVQASGIYPMPVSKGQNASLDWMSEADEQLKVEIYDNIGKLISTTDYPVTIGANVLQIRTSTLASGMYHLKLVGTSTNSFKFIVE